MLLRTFSAEEIVVVVDSPRYMIHDPSLLDSVPFVPAARVVVGGRLSFPPGTTIVGSMLIDAGGIARPVYELLQGSMRCNGSTSVVEMAFVSSDTSSMTGGDRQ